MLLVTTIAHSCKCRSLYTVVLRSVCWTVGAPSAAAPKADKLIYVTAGVLAMLVAVMMAAVVS